MSDMRLIDADALKKNMGVAEAVKHGNKTEKDWQYSYNTLMRYEIADAIDDAPTIDAVPVVHARWIKIDSSGCNYWKCSACGYPVGVWSYGSHYCPHCGAKMDGGASDG